MEILADIILAIVFGATAGLTEWLRRTVAADRLPPNDWAGLRASWAMASDEAWYAAQRATVPGLRVMVAVCAVAASACLVLSAAAGFGWISTEQAAICGVIAGVAAAVVLLALAAVQYRAAKRAVRELEAQHER